MVCKDFNRIYKDEDKNNARLNRQRMNLFRVFLDDMELLELHLHGRLDTWSNERADPTLERIDRVFISDDWVESFPNHNLHALSLQCSDHARLLLRTSCALHNFTRLRFENFWVKYKRFLEIVQQAWSVPCPDVDMFHALDIKLCNTAKALKRWSAKTRWEGSTAVSNCQRIGLPP